MAEQQAKITLIKRTVPRCPACQMTALQLDGEGIKYDVIDITEQPEAIEKYDLTGVPVLLIDKPDGERIRLDGFQPADKVKALL